MSAEEIARAIENDEREWREDAAARALSELPDDEDYGPCVFTVTDAGPCGHPAASHGTDQEVDLDSRPTSPQYLVCFECLEEERPHWSHDFEAASEEEPLNGREPRCVHPDKLWGTCGIPESMHEETFAWAKGSKFYHEYTVPATPEKGQPRA